MRCVKDNNAQCFQSPTGGSICDFPFFCRFTYYSVPNIPLTAAAKKALATSSFRTAQTADDIVKAIVYFDSVTSYIRPVFYREFEMMMKANDLWAEWGIVTWEIQKCTGNIDYTSP